MKASRMVASSEPIEMAGQANPFVSRGGLKLDAALSRFDISVAGKRSMDVGASTGGFADCLLTRGAAQVVAVDVGRGQLDVGLRDDPRVRLMEGTHVLDLTLDGVGGSPFDLVVADLSFISLRKVAPVLLGDLVKASGDVVALVKPQFEAGRAEASKARGVIRDPGIWERVLREVSVAFSVSGAAVIRAMPSPIKGGSGNVEFFLHARAHENGDASVQRDLPQADLAAALEEARESWPPKAAIADNAARAAAVWESMAGEKGKS